MKKEPFSARGIYEDLLKEVIFDLSLEDWVGKDREKHAVGQGFRMNNGLKTETSGLFRNWQSRRIENVPWWWNWDPAKEMENPGRYSKNCTRAILWFEGLSYHSHGNIWISFWALPDPPSCQAHLAKQRSLPPAFVSFCVCIMPRVTPQASASGSLWVPHFC